ncbi:MAG TPA: selenium cofactor biosynthesis protein YqeC [Anaerolineales bacterium]|nr:selenium cofactor biosynthesis protein YqeC [Anaerolineales bacterium]
MYNQKMALTIDRALRVNSSSCIAFTGAGGKTTALFQLARKLQQPVLVTATTHLGSWQVGLADQHIATESPALEEQLLSGVKGSILITGELDGDRTRPVNDKLLNWLYEFCTARAIPLLIEADGSRQKTIKGWAEHEPPIPVFAKQVVQVVGLSALGNPLSDTFVHRAQIFSRISQLDPGETITSDTIINALKHPGGGLKNIPGKAQRVIILNQADTAELQSTANSMVEPLLTSYNSVIISKLIDEKVFAVHEPMAGIVLAAGGSSRYGQTKQLLDWRGEPFVRAVAKTALQAGLAPVVVVKGSNAEQIGAAVDDLDVQLAHNPDWESGQGSSIKAGIQAIRAAGVGGAIFMLADQPQITTSVLHALVEKHAEELHPIVVPMVMDRRANPVLFDLSTFDDLLSIQGDVGGRAIFHKHRVEYLPWHDDRLLLDVDTPEMYQRLITDETL